MKIDENQKICPYPFGRIEAKDDRFTSCCEHWTTDEFAELATKYPGWNGKAAQALREKLLKGDYSFCQTDVCGTEPMSIKRFKERGGKYSPFNHISDKNLEAIESEGATLLPEGPAVVVISADQRCNLKCPSCRKDYVTQLDPIQEKNINHTQKFIDDNCPYIPSVRFNNGEPLFSPWIRSVIQSFSEVKFPRLKHVCLLSNANILSEKGIKDLYPGFRYVDELSLSIDAGDEETYKLVRGGNFNQVLKNIEWATTVLSKDHVRSIDATFVLQKNNYK
ncbi:MAG: radical SAM protein, partial [Bdellovibrionales bacterium]|nr:hypothetical protein [Bdellovibrionales bacterium]NQZ18929.1 radical SAM protein [Bdellovibrionales bacterium]